MPATKACRKINKLNDHILCKTTKMKFPFFISKNQAENKKIFPYFMWIRFKGESLRKN